MSQQDFSRKLRKAVALAWKPGMQAPVIKAHGKGIIAGQIVEIARKNGVLVRQEELPGLVDALQEFQINTGIPPELYAAVAKIFAFLHVKGLNNGMSNGIKSI